MRNVSPNALRAMLAQDTAEVFLVCLTITHPSLADTVRVVNDQVALERAAGGFQPCAFGVVLPNEQEDQLPQVTLELDNVDLLLLQQVRALPAYPRPQVAMEVVLASSPDTVEAGPFNFAIMAIDYDAAVIRGTLGFEEDLLNTAFPAQTYTPTNSKGLFV